MDANTWFTISIVGYSLAVVLLIVTIILFYKMNIKAIIGDLSGKTAARQIQEIREHNTNSGQKRYMPSAFNVERGSLTEPVSSFPSRSKRLGNSNRLGNRGGTGQTVAPISKRLFGRGTTGRTGEQVPKPVLNASKNKEVEAVAIPEALINEMEVLIDGTEVLIPIDSTDHKAKSKVTNVVQLPYAETVVLAPEGGTVVLEPDEAKEEQVYGNETVVLAPSEGTEVLATNDGTEVLIVGNETMVLAPSEGTEVLATNVGTEVLFAGSETMVLAPSE
ncbi:MAG: hypothetical protein AB2401_13045, partial [Bacillus sp. (in: firmicutes)]